jgi:Fic family protein
MERIGDLLQENRMLKKMTLWEVQDKTGIAVSLLSKIERGDRLPTKEQILKLANTYQANIKSLMVEWLSEKIYSQVMDEEFGLEVLMVAEDKVRYGKFIQSEIGVLLNEIDQLKRELDTYRPIPKSQLLNFQEYLKVDYTYESNRIEGNTLTLRETALIMEKGLTINNKTVIEHLEAINHGQAIDLLFELSAKKVNLTERIVKDIHAIILQGVDRENAGQYRNLNVRISGSKHIPPEHFRLNELMEEFIFFYENHKERLHPVLLAADVHERLVTIHPFIDGNGRTSRLLMNLILLQNGYTIANLSGETSKRLEYYESLERKQMSGNSDKFHLLIAKEVKRSLTEYLAVIKGAI